ncbi:MAG: NAD-binding protein [Deltaproteobacteria bacterium]|jgi:voltage-gated potassium channel|nr:NAD-binding protein [Deltaproteobacteria bacterium]
MKRNLITAGTFLIAIICMGTMGYYSLAYLSLGSSSWSISDCFYMTIITLTTVGFGEVIDVASVPGARFFTVFILVCGLGVSAYFISTLTAFLVEGELENLFWRKRMRKEIDKLSNHVILCGGGRVGHYILEELKLSGLDFVLLEGSEERILELQERYGEFPAFVGDATHDEDLKSVGIEKASGIISALDDDKDNLCVVVTCRQLNRKLRVITRCREGEFSSKLKLLGADVVMPNFIGGLRMASQMVRPKTVHYLDIMLRDKKNIVRIEDVTVTEKSNLAGKEISSINFKEYGNLLLLAVMKKGTGQIAYNPDQTYCLQSGDTMVFQAELDALRKLCKKYSLIGMD